MKTRQLALFANCLVCFGLVLSLLASPAHAEPQITFTVTANTAGCLGIDDLAVDSDQRGYLRPFDGDKDGSADCDIGAFELTTYEFLYLPVIVR